MAVLNIVRMGHPCCAGVRRRSRSPICRLGGTGRRHDRDEWTSWRRRSRGRPQVNQDVRLVRLPHSSRAAESGRAIGFAPETQVLINPEWGAAGRGRRADAGARARRPDFDLMEVLDIAERRHGGGGLDGAASRSPACAAWCPRYPRIRYRGIDLEGRGVERDAEGFHAASSSTRSITWTASCSSTGWPDLETLLLREPELHYLLEDDRNPEAGLGERVLTGRIDAAPIRVLTLCPTRPPIDHCREVP